MKSTILIFCLTLLASQLTDATTETAVLDSSGDVVRPGVDYYIIYYLWPGPGGLTLGRRNGTCPFTVTQEPVTRQDGLPVRFYPVDPEAKVVTFNTDTNVAFTLQKPIPSVCPPSSTVWKLRADEGTGKLYVSVGGKIGNPGPDTLANWFKIEQATVISYKFVFNPDVHVDNEIISGDLGISRENDGPWLGLSEPPFLFVIKKA